MAALHPSQLAQYAENAALDCLSGGQTTAHALKAIRAVQALVDKEIEEAAAGVKRACKPGCDHCCHFVLLGTCFEVAAIENHVRSLFTDEQREELRKRLEGYVRTVAPKFGKSLAAVRTPCPFLDGGLCSIYESRPLRCRGMNSLDVNACELRKRRTDQLLRLPMAPGQMEVAQAALAGLQNALPNLGLFMDVYDIARAVGIALEEEGAVQQFLDGEQVFAPAAVRLDPPTLATPSEEFKSYTPGEEPSGRLSVGPLAEHLRLSSIGHTSEAVVKLDFGHPAALIRNLLVPPFYDSEGEIEEWRRRFEAALEHLEDARFDAREGFDALEVLQVFELAYQQRDDKDLMCRLGDVLVDKITARALPDLSSPVDPKPRCGRLKVGYLSCNLSNSNGGYWALGWIRNHSSEIESYALFTGAAADSGTLEFREAADHFFHLDGSVPECARFVKSLGLDAIIFPDIGLAGRNYQFATMRLAPWQCTAWGHPVTSGLPTIDYYLSSKLMEPPNGQDHYREQLVLLPDSGICYPGRKTPASRLVRSDFGLDDGLLYLSCQNPMKLHPCWDFLYREINSRTGRPVVFLEGVRLDATPVKERMARVGVNAHWIPSLSSADFLGLLTLADVCLDTPGWNGGNTTLQSLTLGKPVVSLAAQFMRGRHSLAFLPMAGVPGMVASDPDEYLDLACDEDRRNEATRDLDGSAAFGNPRIVEALDGFLLGLQK